MITTSKKFVQLLFFLTLICSLVFKGIAFAKTHKGGVVFEMPVGAKALGMGEACTAIFMNKTGMFYNPAGIGKTAKNELSFSYQNGIAGSNIGIMDYCAPLSEKLNVGCGLIYHTLGTMELISITGVKRTVNAQKDIVAVLSIVRSFFSWALIGDFSYGMNVKMLNSTLIDDYSATVYAVDLGGIYRGYRERKKYAVGISIQNIGTGITYKNEKEDLSMIFRFGGMYELTEYWIVNLDFVMMQETSKNHFGTEYIIKDNFTLRGGYKIGYDLDSLTFGFGYRFSKKMQIDYGIGLMGNLGQMHLVSLTYKM